MRPRKLQLVPSKRMTLVPVQVPCSGCRWRRRCCRRCRSATPACRPAPPAASVGLATGCRCSRARSLVTDRPHRARARAPDAGQALVGVAGHRRPAGRIAGAGGAAGGTADVVDRVAARTGRAPSDAVVHGRRARVSTGVGVGRVAQLGDAAAHAPAARVSVGASVVVVARGLVGGVAAAPLAARAGGAVTDGRRRVARDVGAGIGLAGVVGATARPAR